MDLKVTPWQELVAKNLKAREIVLDNTLFNTSAELAKEYIYLAHDWYNIRIIHEGQRLVWKTHDLLPTYFDKECREQMAESPTFATTMNNISSILIDILTKPRR